MRRYHVGMSKAEFLQVTGARDSGSIVAAALRYAVIQRHPCIVCGAKGFAHHPDYRFPLDVIWLCQHHHMQEHQRLGTSQLLYWFRNRHKPYGAYGVSPELLRIIEQQ